MNQLKAKIKYLESFLKSEWDFDGYPLETWRNPNVELNDLKYGAKFTNWWSLTAHGETENQAMKNLKQHLEGYKKNNKVIPITSSICTNNSQI